MNKINRYIIDVGTSNNAPYGIRLRDQLNCPVVFIEPNKDALRMVPSNPSDIKINAAITSYDGEIEFNYYEDGTHSILEANIQEVTKWISGYTGQSCTEDDWKLRKKEIVKCHKLSTIIKSLNIEYIPYLKIDTQGHDLVVIKSLENHIHKVEYISCEVQVTNFELYKNQSKKREILQFMEKNNFKLIESEYQTFNQEENLVFKNLN
jgi:FkbM family methyltransferase